MVFDLVFHFKTPCCACDMIGTLPCPPPHHSPPICFMPPAGSKRRLVSRAPSSRFVEQSRFTFSQTPRLLNVHLSRLMFVCCSLLLSLLRYCIWVVGVGLLQLRPASQVALSSRPFSVLLACRKRAKTGRRANSL